MTEKQKEMCPRKQGNVTMEAERDLCAALLSCRGRRARNQGSQLQKLKSQEKDSLLEPQEVVYSQRAHY